LAGLWFNIGVQGPAAETKPPAWWQVLLIGRRPRRTLVRVILLAVVCFVVFKFLLLPIRIEGISMEPTYHDRQVNFVNRMAFWWHPPRRGDVVSVRLAGEHAMYMKRIIGLPGETVSFHEGHAYINGQELDEPYVKYNCDWEHDPIPCGPDQYYVVGDNRSMPFTYHEQGRAERCRIVGKPLL
jgi:signal peptidase I